MSRLGLCATRACGQPAADPGSAPPQQRTRSGASTRLRCWLPRSRVPAGFRCSMASSGSGTLLRRRVRSAAARRRNVAGAFQATRRFRNRDVISGRRRSHYGRHCASLREYTASGWRSKRRAFDCGSGDLRLTLLGTQTTRRHRDSPHQPTGHPWPPRRSAPHRSKRGGRSFTRW